MRRKTSELRRNIWLAGIAFIGFSAGGEAQVITGTPGSPDATFTPNSKVLPAPPIPFKGVITPSAVTSKSAWPPQLGAPKGAPNVLLIITDDVGYGATATFGGVIPTPALDRVAKAGIKFTEFNTTALCSPTRAALLTGRNHHLVGNGVITEISTGFPGYNAIIPRDAATIGEVARQNGYATSWFGKDHNVPPWEASPTGPFLNWPQGQGFDYFFGFVGGDTSQWEPGHLYRNTTRVQAPVDNPQWNLTTAMADDAITYLRQNHEVTPNRPWLMKYAPGGAHAPHHAPPEWIAKFKGRFDGGWEALRDEIFANQKKLGVLPPNAVLTPWPNELPHWNTLSPDEKRLFAHQMEVFAAYLAYTDHEVGRVIQQVEDQGQLDNTLIIYISGDNGGSSEGQLRGTPNEVAYFNGVETPVEKQLAVLDKWGSAATYNHMAAGWAWATDTPYRWVKQVATHFGGIRNGMAISWPARIKDVGSVRHQFHHVVDIYPTILDAMGAPVPTSVNGVEQSPISGVSMAYLFDKANAGAPSNRHTQYFEMFGSRAIYHEGWFANTAVVAPPWDSTAPRPPVEKYTWELYNIVADPTQMQNLAESNPGKLREMQGLFETEAKANQVYPLDNTLMPRLLAKRPGPAAGRTEFVFRGTGMGLTSDAAPSILNRAYTISADFDVPPGGVNGVLATQGGRFGGWGFYLLDSKPVFTWNLLDIARVRFAGAEALAPGKHKVVFSFTPDAAGSPIGRGGVGQMSVDGRVVSEQKMAKTVPFYLQWDDPFDVGKDTGSSVNDADYAVPFAFTGKLDNVTFKLGQSTMPRPAATQQTSEKIVRD